MDAIVATAFWKRLDTEGHDACRLIRRADGWRLAGGAVFDHRGEAVQLAYVVDCAADWRTLSASVRGSVGLEPLSFDIERAPGGEWLLDGKAQPKAGGCVDLDLGFTPATNLIAIRRLQPGADADTPAPAAYYLEFTLELGLVEQTYRRTAPGRLHYRSPAYGYDEVLTVSEIGFVTEYPGLWSGTVALR